MEGGREVEEVEGLGASVPHTRSTEARVPAAQPIPNPSPAHPQPIPNPPHPILTPPQFHPAAP